MTEILPLTSLRFIAAFYVFIFHIHMRWPLTTNQFLSQFLLKGAAGMSLFFILSGFVMYYRYHKVEFTSIATKNYIVHRFSRIYPIYFLAAVVSLPWMGFSCEGEGVTAVVIYISRLLFIIFTNIFLLQAWFPQLFLLWNDSASWSVSVEAFFYSFFPFIQKFLLNRPIKSVLLVGCVSYIFVALFGLALSLFPEDYVLRVVYSVPIFRLPEFIIGIIAAVISLKYDYYKINYSWVFCFSMLLVIIILTFCGGVTYVYSFQTSFIVPLITSMIYSAAKCKSGIIYSILSCKPLVWLGHSSYSFYSLQVLAIFYIAPNYKKLLGHLPFWSSNGVFLAVIFFCLVLMSSLSYYFIEEPIRRSINKKFLND